MSTGPPTSTLWAAVMVLRLKAWVPFGINQPSLNGYVTSGVLLVGRWRSTLTLAAATLSETW